MGAYPKTDNTARRVNIPECNHMATVSDVGSGCFPNSNISFLVAR